MRKFVNIICIEPDGNIKLENVCMKKTSTGLSIGKGNCSQGPEFSIYKDNKYFSFVLDYKSHDKDSQGQSNIYSHEFLDSECGCGYSDKYSEIKGNFYLSKHDPSIGKGHEFDFTKEISYEEWEKYDTTVNCTLNDIEFVKSELIKRKYQNWLWSKKLTIGLLIGATIIPLIFQVKKYF